ncbi:hypothetical protein trd_0725 [Thermomicrobium roseum DSM 5159]|uniref:Uncharacterized protein n=1 Tax=Thermomicrobium roseum (strain ATCC 27502 / DSM 5159 / P-2) TaxID=309801 RepID=B9KZ14_THERP|nr:hypothetical protein trd_0725 [Thermomicrobium roseum DSM 5159]
MLDGSRCSASLSISLLSAHTRFRARTITADHIRVPILPESSTRLHGHTAVYVH